MFRFGESIGVKPCDFLPFVALCCFLGEPGPGVRAQDAPDVSKHHKHESRDGLYVDRAFTQTAAAALKRDLGFNGSIAGNVYAQPLYIQGGPDDKAMIISVTEMIMA